MLSRTRLTGLIALTALLTAGGNSRADDDAASLLAEFVGEIVAGGEWQTANPDYRTDTEQPSHFSLRYRWGPGRSQVVSELVGVFKERPETPVYWTIYTYVDPETRSVEVLQIGAGGGLAKGTMTMNAQGQRIIDQTGADAYLDPDDDAGAGRRRRMADRARVGMDEGRRRLGRFRVSRARGQGQYWPAITGCARACTDHRSMRSKAGCRRTPSWYRRNECSAGPYR